MDYIVRIPAVRGDVVPLVCLADCMTREAAVTPYGGAPFNQQRYDFDYRNFTTLLLSEARTGRMQVCDAMGTPATAQELIGAATDSGNLSEVRRYIVEPDWDQLKKEHPPVAGFDDVRDFTGVDLGVSVIDWDATHLHCLHVKHHFLNEWGRTRGDRFSISHDGVEWVESWDNKKGGYDTHVYCAAAPVEQAPLASLAAKPVSTEPPGKRAGNTIGNLAIKAAWEIECKTARRASDIDVMARLQAWADNGDEPADLKKSDKAKRSVIWITKGGKEKAYTIEACQKTLKTWNESRA